MLTTSYLAYRLRITYCKKDFTLGSLFDAESNDNGVHVTFNSRLTENGRHRNLIIQASTLITPTLALAHHKMQM